MKKVIQIKQQPQENGLWGSPQELYAIDDPGVLIEDPELEKLRSAIIIALAEQFETPFRIYWFNDKGFFMSFDSPVDKDAHGRRHYFITYSDYKLQGDLLVYECRPDLKASMI